MRRCRAQAGDRRGLKSGTAEVLDMQVRRRGTGFCKAAFPGAVGITEKAMNQFRARAGDLRTNTMLIRVQRTSSSRLSRFQSRSFRSAIVGLLLTSQADASFAPRLPYSSRAPRVARALTCQELVDLARCSRACACASDR